MGNTFVLCLVTEMLGFISCSHLAFTLGNKELVYLKACCLTLKRKKCGTDIAVRMKVECLFTCHSGNWKSKHLPKETTALREAVSC